MLTRQEIEEIIPHRDPFLLVDEIIELEPTIKAAGLKHVKEDEYYFKGHFPGQPIMPGVLIVEALAQVGAVVVLSADRFKGKIALFASADGVKFRKQVVPGDTLRLECEIIRIRGNFGVGYGIAYVGDEIACEGKLTFAITEA